MITYRPIQTAFLAAGMLCMGTPLWADSSDGSIGLFTAVHGKVGVMRAGSPAPLPVHVQDDVFFRDMIETKSKARTKAFFDDETILTVGENSRVSVDEHIYDPEANVRRVVVKLLMGKLRALVGKAFTGAGSKFEIHTPTAVAAARGTYFIVWVEENGASGLVNIGEVGKVDFTSGGRTVTVSPGEFSIAPAHQAPAAPVVFNPTSGTNGPSISGLTAGRTIAGTDSMVAGAGGTLAGTLDLANQTVGALTDVVQGLVGGTPEALASVSNAISGTDVKDALKLETPQQTVQALGLATPILSPSTRVSALGPSANRPVGASDLPGALDGGLPDTLSGNLAKVETIVTQVLSAPPIVSSPVSAVVSGPVSTVVSTVTNAPVIPPAVTSGVTDLTGTLGLPLP